MSRKEKCVVCGNGINNNEKAVSVPDLNDGQDGLYRHENCEFGPSPSQLEDESAVREFLNSVAWSDAPALKPRDCILHKVNHICQFTQRIDAAEAKDIAMANSHRLPDDLLWITREFVEGYFPRDAAEDACQMLEDAAQALRVLSRPGPIEPKPQHKILDHLDLVDRFVGKIGPSEESYVWEALDELRKEINTLIENHDETN